MDDSILNFSLYSINSYSQYFYSANFDSMRFIFHAYFTTHLHERSLFITKNLSKLEMSLHKRDIFSSHWHTWDTRLALYAASCLRYSFFAVSVFFLYTCQDKTNKQSKKNILRGQSCSSCSCAQLFLEMGSNGSPFMSHNA